MLSILIPVYNYSIDKLIKVLFNEASNSAIIYELIVIDDNSTNSTIAELNKKNCSKYNVIYLENQQNIGRTATRERLAKTAKYPNLLFLDSDVLPKSSNFISVFYPLLGSVDIIFGGISYENNIPQSNQLLRWKYGHERESNSIKKRNTKPYLSIISMCFVIKKELFLEISTSLQINSYGMDVLFAYEMEKRNLSLVHIDNPIIHLGLENNSIFIAKTESAMKTLISLQNKQLIPENYRPIQQKLNMLKRYKLNSVFKIVIKKTIPILLLNLKSKKPNMKIFDIYRLYCMAKHDNPI